MIKLTEQVAESTREAMKNLPKKEVNLAVRRAVRDVAFLLKLQMQVNTDILMEQKNWNPMAAALAYAQLRIEIIRCRGLRNDVISAAVQGFNSSSTIGM